MHLTVNGVTYCVAVQGSGPAVFLLHGFTGSGATWAPHLAALEGLTTVCVDFLGHGRSDAPADAARYAMDACVDDVLALRDRLGIQRCAVVGYSMGGRVAMRVALQAPESLWALVLESTSPGIADAADRRTRIVQDKKLADRIRNQGVAAFVDYWQALPLFASQSRLPDAILQALRHQRLQHSANGLANSLQGLGAGMQAPVLEELRGLRLPVLLLAGALDEKYCGQAGGMAAVLPRSRVCIVPDAGHAIHLEQPAAFDDALREFLHAHAPLSSESLP